VRPAAPLSCLWRGFGDGGSSEKVKTDKEVPPAAPMPLGTLFGTVPNVMTVCRMAMAPVVCYYCVSGSFGLATAGAQQLD
jgi:hypothetical protein